VVFVLEDAAVPNIVSYGWVERLVIRKTGIHPATDGIKERNIVPAAVISPTGCKEMLSRVGINQPEILPHLAHSDSNLPIVIAVFVRIDRGSDLERIAAAAFTG